MPDFTTITLQANTNTLASPTWTALGGANTEVRWSDAGTGLLTTGSASWPAMIRPATVQTFPYTYAYTADATGIGFIGAGGNPPTFNDSNYLWARWSWDNMGRFASAPIFTAYNDTNHNSPTGRGGGGVLAGHASDTTGNTLVRSYLKANAFGRVVGDGPPVAAPANDPVASDGTAGSVSPSAGANWLANYQDLMADLDYITAPFSPAPTVADQWNVIFCLWTGPNQNPGTLTWVLSLKYTWT